MQERTIPNKLELKKQYEAQNDRRALIIHDFEGYVQQHILPVVSHVTLKARPKSFASFFKKYIRYLREDPGIDLPQIPDQIGIRIICPFLEDLKTVEEACRRHLEVLEIERKGSGYSFKEFGYESIHLLARIPGEILARHNADFVEVAEIQIRTILQDAWAEVEHELVYKIEFTPYDDQMKRKLAAVNASLSLADTVFQEIRNYQRQFRQELDKRHSSFFKKVEEYTTDEIFSPETAGIPAVQPVGFPAVQPDKTSRLSNLPASSASTSIDDLLLNALYVHNKGEFDRAVEFYTVILGLSPPAQTASIIYKHRGMAYFAMSRYENAIADFTEALKLDPTSYKAAYYRAVVHQVEKNYTEAVDDFSFALSLNPYQAWALYRRAQVYYHIGDYPAALADCESALSLDHDFNAAAKFKAVLLTKLQM